MEQNQDTRVIWQTSEMISDTIIYRWSIKNFSVSHLLGGIIKSPSVRCFDTDFHLEMSRNSNQIQVRLALSASDDPPLISSGCIGFLFSDKIEWDNRNFAAPVKVIDMSHAVAVNAVGRDYIVDNELIVGCTLIAKMINHTLDAQSTPQSDVSGKKTFSQQGFSTLAKSIGGMMDDSKFSDVTLKVGDYTFQAHKGILASRSRVFDGMFESGMKENQEGVVQMLDMESSTVKEMLQYIYTGEIDELSMDRAIDLYVAADRYDLPELMEWCKDFIVKHISADDVCNVAVLADLHHDEGLSKAASRVFKLHSRTIVKSQAWRDLAENHISVYRDLVESTLS